MDRMGALILMLASVAVTGLAAAQTAPAGNAHPTPEAVTHSEAQVTNPFGEASWDTHESTDDQRRASAEAKARLAAAVDLDPLRDLAVFHSGRVKILDTLARETVRRIAGRTNYQELTPESDAAGHITGVAKQSFDPLFTLLDLVIDPAYYAGRPLIHVEYLPLRRALVEAAFPS